MQSRTDRVTLVNRDGDTAEISQPLLRIGPSAEAGRDVHAAELAGVDEPTPGWAWLLTGVVLTLFVLALL